MEQKLCNDSPIVLGRQGEYGINTIKFDCSDWVKEHGEGTILLLHKRSRDQYPYLVPIERVGNIVSWNITAVETAMVGFGKAEYRFIANGKLAKSMTVQTKVLAALETDNVIPIPDPYETWIEKIAKKFVEIDTKLVETSQAISDETNRAKGAEAELNRAIFDLKTSKADKSEVYTKTQIDELVAQFVSIVNGLQVKLDYLTPPEGYAYLIVKETK